MCPETLRKSMTESVVPERDNTEEINNVARQPGKEGKKARNIRLAAERQEKIAKVKLARQRQSEAAKSGGRIAEVRQEIGLPETKAQDNAAQATEQEIPFSDLYLTEEEEGQIAIKVRAKIPTKMGMIDTTPDSEWQLNQSSELGKLNKTVEKKTIKEILEEKRKQKGDNESATITKRISIADTKKSLGIPENSTAENITIDDLKSRAYNWKARASGFDPTTEAMKAKHRVGVIDQRGLKIEELSQITPPPTSFWGRLLDKTKQVFDPNLRAIRENQLLSTRAETLMKKTDEQKEKKFELLPDETDKTWEIDATANGDDQQLSEDSELHPKNIWSEKNWKESVVGKGAVDKTITQIESRYDEAAGKKMAAKAEKMPELSKEIKDTNARLEELREEAAEASWGFLGTSHPKFDADGNIINLPGGNRDMLIADLEQRIKKAESKGNFDKQNKLERWKEVLIEYLNLIEKRTKQKENWEKFLQES